MPFPLKRSLSLVNAAFTTPGVAVTVGQAFDPVRFTSGVCSTSYMRKSEPLRPSVMPVARYSPAGNSRSNASYGVRAYNPFYALGDTSMGSITPLFARSDCARIFRGQHL